MGVALGSNTLNNFYLGSTQLSALYVGNDKVWPVGGGSFFIGGRDFSQIELEGKLTGETLTSWSVIGGNTVATSSTNYSINNTGFGFTTGLTSYIDSGGCTLVGQDAFYNQSTLISASFLGATIVDRSAFEFCTNLRYVNLPSWVTASGGGETFFGCSNLVSASFPNLTFQPSPQVLADGIFGGCTSLKYVDLPKFIHIPFRMFDGCNSLPTVNIPLATKIYQWGFRNCTSLKSVSFPNVSSVDAQAFITCTSLTSINLPALSGPTALGGSTGNDNVFTNLPNTGSITVPSYLSASNAGVPDGDLVYLTTSPRSWTINYI